jgi:hypothetical protein
MELKVFEYVEKKNEYLSLEDNNSSWTPNADAVLDGLKMSPNEKVCDTVHKITIQTAKQLPRKIFSKASCRHAVPILRLSNYTTVRRWVSFLQRCSNLLLALDLSKVAMRK